MTYKRKNRTGRCMSGGANFYDQYETPTPPEWNTEKKAPSAPKSKGEGGKKLKKRTRRKRPTRRKRHHRRRKSKKR